MSADPNAIADGVRVAIFDLDGTLYEGDGFVPAYLEQLEVYGGLDPELARGELEQILGGVHGVRIGDLYDPTTDRVLRAPAWRIIEVSDWDGTPVDDPRVGTGISYGKGLVYIGDAWQAVRAVAQHHGVDHEASRASFHAVRARINTEADQLLDTSALAPVLAELDRFEYREVMTNTPEDLAQPLVVSMGLPDRFHAIRFGVDKPLGLERRIDEVLEEFDVTPDEVLCVGDNYLNDILPTVRAGCRAIWVDPFGTAPHEGPELRVAGLAEVAPLLRAGR